MRFFLIDPSIILFRCFSSCARRLSACHALCVRSEFETLMRGATTALALEKILSNVSTTHPSPPSLLPALPPILPAFSALLQRLTTRICPPPYAQGRDPPSNDLSEDLLTPLCAVTLLPFPRAISAQLTSAAKARGFRANLWLSDFFLFPFELRGDADPIPVEWPSSIDKERVVNMFNIELTTKGTDRLRPSKGPPPSQKVERKKGYSNPLCAVSMFPFPDAISDQLNAAASERRFLSDFWMLEYHMHLLRFKSIKNAVPITVEWPWALQGSHTLSVLPRFTKLNMFNQTDIFDLVPLDASIPYLI